MTIGKDTFEICYVAATPVPDTFDKTKTDIRIVLTDKPVAARPDLPEPRQRQAARGQ